MTTVAVLGTGRMGTALTKILTETSATVWWASRHPEQLAQRNLPWAGPVTLCRYQDALRADIIIPAFWYRDLLAWIADQADALAGKILVDLTNPFNAAFDDLTLDCHTSAAEEIQGQLPDTFVVGCFKNTFWSVMEAPRFQEPISDVFVTSDHAAAKAEVLTVFQPLPFRFLDAGGLRNNRTIERMTVLARELAIRYDHYPRVAYRLWGQ